MFRLEIARQHLEQLPDRLALDWAGEKPMMAPRLGTRSTDCTGLVINHARANPRAQRHHPGGAAGGVAGAMMLESVATSVLIGIAPKIWKDEECRVAGVFRFLLNGLPQFPAEPSVRRIASM